MLRLRPLLATRWWPLPDPLQARAGLRIEVVPPSLRHAPTASWQRLMFWLLAPAPHRAAPPPSRLPLVRTDFVATLADIDGVPADALRQRIADTHSLRELWHLRAEVFRVVGLAHSEVQAEQRLALLNRHFPTRSPRPPFATLAKAPL